SEHPTPVVASPVVACPAERWVWGFALTKTSRRLPRRRLGLGLAHLPLQLLAAVGEGVVLGLYQEGVEAAAALDRPQGMSADTQAHAALQGVADECDIDKVRPERPLGLVLGVAAQLARHGALAGQLATACHSGDVLGKCALWAR